MQIGTVARRVALSLRTVRHYEEEGLIRSVARTAGGFRLYGEDAVTRLQLVKQMKTLGFTLEEVRLLLDSRKHLADPTVDAHERALHRDAIALLAIVATQRVRELRERLANAETFVATLEHDVARLHAHRETRETHFLIELGD
jgi:DNA-binding transcriptional MerR regulator